MILANIHFGTLRKHDREDLEDAAESYLAALLKGGQVAGHWFLTWTKGRLNAHVGLVSSAALDPQHHTGWGTRELAKITLLFGKAPVWKLLDDDADEGQPSWNGAPFLFLSTHFLDIGSPVARGDGGQPVPVYAFPILEDEKDGIYRWQCTYRDLDSLWIGGGALELASYRQLAEPDSQFSQEGRMLCGEIERATGIPVFYYLMRYWGRSKGEEDRLCPGCGRKWAIARQRGLKAGFHEFDFKCGSCRLVSHVGVSTDGGRHARIGEFRPDSKKQAKPG